MFSSLDTSAVDVGLADMEFKDSSVQFVPLTNLDWM